MGLPNTHRRALVKGDLGSSLLNFESLEGRRVMGIHFKNAIPAEHIEIWQWEGILQRHNAFSIGIFFFLARDLRRIFEGKGVTGTGERYCEIFRAFSPRNPK